MTSRASAAALSAAALAPGRRTPLRPCLLAAGAEIARRLIDPGTAMAQGTALAISGPGSAKTLAAVTTTLLLICGCTARAPGPGAPGPARAPASPASPSQAAARGALAAYTGMWQQMQAAGVTADWEDPRLAAYASGHALRTLVTGLHKARDQGIVIKGTIVTHPRVVSVTPAASGPGAGERLPG